MLKEILVSVLTSDTVYVYRIISDLTITLISDFKNVIPRLVDIIIYWFLIWILLTFISSLLCYCLPKYWFLSNGLLIKTFALFLRNS